MNTFNATDKNVSQAERIRRQYLDKEANKMAQLQKLDDKVKAPGKVISGILGAIGALVMGGGMSYVMVWGNLTIGLALGIPGMLVALAVYPVYKLITGIRKKKYAAEIMHLSSEFLQPLCQQRVEHRRKANRHYPMNRRKYCWTPSEICRPMYFVMIGLYAGMRREEILALQWDCVFLDVETPYITVKRAWHSEKNRPVINTELKAPAAKRNIPIPKCLVDCLQEVKRASISDCVIADRDGQTLSYSQFQRIWNYISVRSTDERAYYTYTNGKGIKHTMKPTLGSCQKNNPKLVYTMDFHVTAHQLRHTYIMNLIYAGVDPKTVQYLAGHESSKVTMDIYAKVKYNKPAQLLGVVNAAFGQRTPTS